MNKPCRNLKILSKLTKSTKTGFGPFVQEMEKSAFVYGLHTKRE